MSKGLEALEELKQELLEVVDYLDKKDVSYLAPIHHIEKELKALEIIKKKVIVIPFLILHLSSNDLNGYNKAMDKKHKLTQEEFDLVKEVLLWE